MLGRYIVVGFCLLATLVAARPATAQIDPALEADIGKLLDATGARAIAEQLSASVSDEIWKALRSARPDLPGRAFDILNEVTKATVAKSLQAPNGPVARVVPLYAKHFTHDEIRELLSFYETDTGRKVLRVMPSLMQESMQVGREWALEMAPQVDAEIQKRFREEGFLEKRPAAAPAERKGPFENLFDPNPPPPETPPQVLKEVEPQYTQSAFARKIEGNVVLECIVLTDGGVGECKVVRSLDPGLDSEAITAARGWRFIPGKKNGLVTPVVVTLEMSFKLRGRIQPPVGAFAAPEDVSETPAPPASPRFAKGQRYVLDGKMGLAPASLVFKYQGDGPLEAELTVEGFYGFRQPIRLKGSLVEVDLRLSAGDLKLEGTFNGGKVTGSYQLNGNSGGTFTLASR